MAATMYGTSIFFKDRVEAEKFSGFMNAFTAALHKKVSGPQASKLVAPIPISALTGVVAQSPGPDAGG